MTPDGQRFGMSLFPAESTIPTSLRSIFLLVHRHMKKWGSELSHSHELSQEPLLDRIDGVFLENRHDTYLSRSFMLRRTVFSRD